MRVAGADGCGDYYQELLSELVFQDESKVLIS
jgi:hypothetical protein